MNTRNTLLTGLASLVIAGCGSAENEEQRPEEVSKSEWRLTERTYPFVGEYGETVCKEWHRVDEDGTALVHREWYHFDRLNDALAERVSLECGVLEAVNARSRARQHVR